MTRRGLKARWLGLLLAASFFMPGLARAAADLQAGLAWLENRITSTGEVLNEGSAIATPLQVRSEVIHTLTLLSRIPVSALVDAVGAEADGGTEYLARQMRAYVQAGRDADTFVTALLADQNADGGFGGGPGYRSSPLDTAWALLALRAAGYSGAGPLQGALGYLAAAANSDGGYGLAESPTGSQVYVTALALDALQAFSQNYSLGAPIASARRWLLAQQSNGAYGETVLDAVAASALIAGTTDAVAFSGSIDAIAAAQQGDGSWGGDPYLTALALRAMFLAGQWTAPPATGNVTGLVLEQGSFAPIAGARIRLLEVPSAETTAGSDGRFMLTGVAPGTYTVEIAHSGHATATLAGVRVSAGNTANLGNVFLGFESTAALLRGTVTDGATGAPLAGAAISLSGDSTDSTVAGADGGYQFSSLPAGTFTITVAAPGYDSVTATATLAANTVALFSPSLYPTGTTPTTATLRGEVVDAATGQPIAGATITAAAQTATTDATGHFTLAGLGAGALSATVSAQGYTGATLTGTLANGVNEAGTLRLAPLPAAVTTVSGTVRDAGTGQPIPGASVRLQEVADAVFTGADGHYQLSGITAEAFTVTASAAGYLSRTAGVSAQLGSTVAADFDLDRSQSAGGIRIETVTTDQPAYDPYGKMEISAEVSNASDQTADLIFSATIRDASLNLVAEVPAIQLVLGQSPGDAVQPVPAHGNATIEIDWPNTATPAGTYSVVVRAVTMGGAVIAEGGTGFDINALQRIGGGITVNPPITQADSQQPIALGANLLNAGNLPIPAGPAELTVTLANPDNVPPPPPVAGVKTLHSGVPLATPRGGVFDEAGNYYVVNGSDRRVIKIDPAGQAEILATLPSTLAVNSIIPVDLTRDSAGALWILNSAQLVLKLAPDGTLSSRTTGLTSQTGFDLDPDGNFYITGNQGTDRVLARLDPTGQLTILVANGLSGPTGLVSAGDGTWFVSNYNDNTVARIDADGHVTPFATGLNRPQGLTRDGQGHLYVANSGANSVVRIAPDGTPSIHAAGLNGPADLRFNSAGELFVSNAGDNTVAKVLPDGTVRTFARGIAVNPEGMQYDPAGDLYIANGNGSVTRLDAAGGYSVVATGLGSPKDLEIGPGGEIYVANYAGGRVMKISGSGVSTLASGLQSPYGLAFDGNGLLHVAESSANRLSTLDGSGQRTTVLDSLLNSPQDALEAPGGQIRVLSSKFIATLGSHGQGGLVASGFSGALGFTLASDGGFYVVDGSTTVKRVDPAGAITTVKSGLPYNPYGGITADDAGNLYLADYSNRQIVKLDAAGTVSSFAVLGTYPIRLIRDAQGGYYSLSVNGEIHAIGSGGSVALVTTLSGARNLALAADGRLFVATSSSVVVLSTAGVKTTLLSGLSDASDALPLANGQWITVERTLGQLKIYDAQNALAEQINGFNAPRDLL